MFILNFRRCKPCLPEVILRRAGQLSFIVGITNGQVFRRHLKYLCTRIAEIPPEEQDVDEWSYYKPGEQVLSGLPNLLEPAHQFSIRIRHPPNRYEPS